MAGFFLGSGLGLVAPNTLEPVITVRREPKVVPKMRREIFSMDEWCPLIRRLSTYRAEATHGLSRGKAAKYDTESPLTIIRAYLLVYPCTYSLRPVNRLLWKVGVSQCHFQQASLVKVGLNSLKSSRPENASFLLPMSWTLLELSRESPLRSYLNGLARVGYGVFGEVFT